MVWDLRPSLSSVRSMSALPMTGLAYAVNGKFTPRASRAPSQTTSPPPEYNIQSAELAVGAATADVKSRAPGPTANPDAAHLQRALAFQKQKGEAVDRARYIAQGHLMSKSSLETQLSATTPEELAFGREVYLDAMDYFVRGLPSDLSDSEAHHLRTTMHTLAQSCHLDATTSTATDGTPSPTQSSHRTQQVFVALCRGTATLIKLSIPRIKYGITTLIDFENQHHVLERSGTIVSNSLYSVADGAAKTKIRVPDVSGLLGGLYTGLSLGLLEGYRVLASEEEEEAEGKSLRGPSFL